MMLNMVIEAYCIVHFTWSGTTTILVVQFMKPLKETFFSNSLRFIASFATAHENHLICPTVTISL